MGSPSNSKRKQAFPVNFTSFPLIMAPTQDASESKARKAKVAKPQRKSVWNRFQSQYLTWFTPDPAAAGSPVKKPVDNRMSKDIRISAQCGYYEQDSSWAVSDKKTPKNSN